MKLDCWWPLAGAIGLTVFCQSALFAAATKVVIAEAQYVMAALADDVFIHLNWEGKHAWTSNLLEAALFGSHTAGEKVFEKLDRLLRDRDPADRSLAAVYLNALSLGFRGKYYGVNDHGRLRRYRNELFAFIFRQPADLVNDAKVEVVWDPPWTKDRMTDAAKLQLGML